MERYMNECAVSVIIIQQRPLSQGMSAIKRLYVVPLLVSCYYRPEQMFIS